MLFDLNLPEKEEYPGGSVPDTFIPLGGGESMKQVQFIKG
jgi:hypothetical protein